MIDIDIKETVGLVRQSLKEAFPATRFSVRRGAGSCWNYIDVRWINGPTRLQVGEITGRFVDHERIGYDELYAPPNVVVFRMENGRPVPLRFAAALISLYDTFERQGGAESADVAPQPSPTADAIQRLSNDAYKALVQRIFVKEEQDALRVVADAALPAGTSARENAPARRRL
jgi:hypothetical protein